MSQSYPHDREWEHPPDYHEEDDESEESSSGGILRSIFGPIIGFVALCALILVVFGVIFAVMTLASANGTPISGGYGWLLILVGAYVINRIVNA